MEISKVEAASRLLDTAIRLFFEGADAVAVHSLAAASLNIFSDLAEHGGNSWRAHLGDDSKLSAPEMKRVLNSAWNFFKHADRDPDGTIRRCSKCNAKMWPSPISKPCTFHELRHTTATLLLAAGADLWAVQKMLRHTDAQVTTERYAHLVPGYLQEQITRLKLISFASPLLPPAANDKGPTDPAGPNTQGLREVGLERETGVEPATLSLGS